MPTRYSIQAMRIENMINIVLTIENVILLRAARAEVLSPLPAAWQKVC
jgi:hypothetical protein